MQKKRYLALFLLFAIPYVYGLCEERAVEGWVNSTSNITAKDNRSFNIIIASDAARILANLPTGNSVTVKNGECEILDFYDICFAGVNASYHDYEEDRDYYKAKVVIYDLPACINLSRTIDRTDLLINEGANVNVVIFNSGEREATDVMITDRFPSPFVITAVSGCEIERDKVIWRGSLDRYGEKKCSYTVKPAAKTNYTSKLNLSYYNGKKTKYMYSDSQSFKIPDYELKIAANLSAQRASVNDQLTFYIKIQNNHSSYPIRIENFYIDIPIGLKIMNVPVLLEREYNKFRWQKTLEPSAEVESTIELKVEEEEYYAIKIHAEFLTNNVRKSFDKLLKINEPLVPEDITIPIEEDIPIEANESAVINQSVVDLINVTNSSEVVIENLSTTPTGATNNQTVILEKKESLFKKIYDKVFKNPIFIAVDAVLIALIVMILINLKKGKEK